MIIIELIPLYFVTIFLVSNSSGEGVMETTTDSFESGAIVIEGICFGQSKMRKINQSIIKTVDGRVNCKLQPLVISHFIFEVKSGFQAF